MEFKAGRTVAEILEITGQKPNSVGRAWARKVTQEGGRGYGDAGGLNAVPTEQEFTVLWGKKVGRVKQMSVAVPSAWSSELRPIRPTKAKAAFRWPKLPKISATLLDLVIWAEVGLGCYSISSLINQRQGWIVCVVIALFFENARRTMRQEPKATEALPGTPEYETVSNYNSALNRSKTFAFLTVAFIAITFMVCNYKTFYRALSVESDFQIDFYGLELAKVASCWLAVLMSGIAYLSLRGISLSKNLSALK